jgi:hypothetical protein
MASRSSLDAATLHLRIYFDFDTSAQSDSLTIMTLNNIRATLGLSANATLGAAGTSGSLSLGQTNQTINLTYATLGYSSQIIFANSGDATTLNLPINGHTSTTAWVAGVAQVETATAAGTVSAAGNASVVFTAAGMAGSPKTFAVAVANGDTPAVWAGKVRAALAADSAVSAMFTISGASTSIVATRKPTTSFAVPTGTLGIYAANDTTLNISLATGTATGITTAATSANTTPGVLTDGVKIYDGDGNDLEGVSIAMSYLAGLQVVVQGSSVVFTMGTLNPGEVHLRAAPDLTPIGVVQSQVMTANGPASVKVTVFGG